MCSHDTSITMHLIQIQWKLLVVIGLCESYRACSFSNPWKRMAFPLHMSQGHAIIPARAKVTGQAAPRPQSHKQKHTCMCCSCPMTCHDASQLNRHRLCVRLWWAHAMSCSFASTILMMCFGRGSCINDQTPSSDCYLKKHRLSGQLSCL